MKRWRLKRSKATAEELQLLCAEFSLPSVVAYILTVRGYITKSEVKAYLSSDLDSLPKATLMKDMDKACDLLCKAIKDKKKIVVFGDYDADGITSTSILTLGLRRLGGEVDYYIPQREVEGYGLNSQAVSDLALAGYELLLTTDNGISAFEQVALARELGMTVIVSDHHELSFTEGVEGNNYIYPNANAIINPKQPDCPYPYKSLCAGTIAYKIVETLYEKCGRDFEDVRLEYLSLAAVAAVCDIMDMTDENRALLRYVLPRICESGNLGLQSLLEKTGLCDKEITTYHVGFVIGPCINASGRLELANIAVDLFMSDNKDEADKLADRLVELNNSRKHLSNEGVELVSTEIERLGLQSDKVIVVHCQDLHESIAGIVAGRIKEMYYRPTFVLAGDKDIVRGSGRSIEGYNMFESLQEASDLLEVFGGHPMAAGLSVAASKVSDLRKRLNNVCSLKLDDMVATTYIDSQLNIEKVSLPLAEALKCLEPCGKANSAPLFGDKELRLRRLQLLGSGEKVVRLYFDSRYSKGNISAITFRQRDMLKELIMEKGGEWLWNELLEGVGDGVLLDIVYSISVNNYNNRKYPQIQIEDFRLSEK